jgi:hypothetical protein
MEISSAHAVRATSVPVTYTRPTNGPKNYFDLYWIRECCLLAGILDVGWPFPFHTAQSERRVDAISRRAIFVANVVDFGVFAGPDCRGVGVERMDSCGNSGTCFVCGRSTRGFVDSVVRLGMRRRPSHISISKQKNGWRRIAGHSGVMCKRGPKLRSPYLVYP